MLFRSKASSPKKGLTLRERRLIFKRDGTRLTTPLVAIRDSINSALNAVIIQRVECNPCNDLLFTTMETVRATSLNSEISQFLHLIPGTTTVHLESPTAQLLVHGVGIYAPNLLPESRKVSRGIARIYTVYYTSALILS